jgi:AAA15 family ATPase/GTPase
MSTTTAEEIKTTKANEDKNSELLLDSLEIKGYRCFEHLTIEKLGRVNLIVGKNNTGKTALLEALWIYAEAGDPFRLSQISYYRDERPDPPIRLSVLQRTVAQITSDFVNSQLEDQNKRENQEYPRYLFYGRPNENKTPIDFEIGTRFSEFEDPSTVHEDKVIVTLRYEPQTSLFNLSTRQNSKTINRFIRSNGLTLDLMSEFWDEISLTSLEDLVVESLKIIFTNIQRISFIGFPKGAKNRIAVARVQGENEPVPLKSLGEGMTRLLGVTLAIVNCQNGILLIDEIENGLHYSVLPDIWRMIFKTARDLNVQVFATTHSWDCINAFTKAAIEDEESEGMLIRLVRKNDQIRAVTFSEKELETVTKDRIEVR